MTSGRWRGHLRQYAPQTTLHLSKHRIGVPVEEHTGKTGLLTALGGPGDPDDESEITGELPDWLDEEMPVEALPAGLAAEIDSSELGDAWTGCKTKMQETETTSDNVPDFFDTDEFGAQA